MDLSSWVEVISPMKRGLKFCILFAPWKTKWAVEVISPMKRGLKYSFPLLLSFRLEVEVISPMKRGLKS